MCCTDIIEFLSSQRENQEWGNHVFRDKGDFLSAVVFGQNHYYSDEQSLNTVCNVRLIGWSDIYDDTIILNKNIHNIFTHITAGEHQQDIAGGFSLCVLFAVDRPMSGFILQHVSRKHTLVMKYGDDMLNLEYSDNPAYYPHGYNNRTQDSYYELFAINSSGRHSIYGEHPWIKRGQMLSPDTFQQGSLSIVSVLLHYNNQTLIRRKWGIDALRLLNDMEAFAAQRKREMLQEYIEGFHDICFHLEYLLNRHNISFHEKTTMVGNIGFHPVSCNQMMIYNNNMINVPGFGADEKGVTGGLPYSHEIPLEFLHVHPQRSPTYRHKVEAQWNSYYTLHENYTTIIESWGELRQEDNCPTVNELDLYRYTEKNNKVLLTVMNR